MGDVKELMQITPETPGRIPILNPFESPSDYSNLHEQTLASPSVFKSTKLPTPGEFRWSIDQLAVINPVEIDPEEIHRQASYLSHSRIDKDVEDKRQKAIEEFFTKDVIVPSPWTDHDGKQLSDYHCGKCININSDSPAGKKLSPHIEKCNTACQTLLSLPVDFNLENLLGDYFRTDEFVDQSPGNLSSSSLRRKLFLDGNGSISDSLPSASPRSPQSSAQASLEVFYAVDVSPVQCRSPVQTPSSGQFSSSPIRGSSKRYSLGSVTSPSAISSPTFSPVTLQVGKTPLSEQRKFPFHSPDVSSGKNSNGITNPCIRSPFIDGCSPIRNCSPVRLEMCGSTQHQSSLIHLPFDLETHSKEQAEDDKENIPSILSSPVTETGRGWPWSLKSDTSAGSPRVLSMAMSMTQSQSSASERELALLEDIESVRENDTVDMADPIETVDESTWIKESGDNENSPMTDFMSGIAFSIESSHMCMSPLAESSVLPCEGSNIQMDSGYNTQTCGSNIMDTVGAESYCKENDEQTCEVEIKSKVCISKSGHTAERCWMKTASSTQYSSP
ncbi:protein aurora borealis [Perognathus longimembris pacificus]|uniref:protein aurora borealis n=1 Tax=Perognathus longimembris pacificus TaxID=214514 RepID=UPI00201A04A9|nr:protein aurora borealis [Perognathus longimembris pacificus]XP_048197212.1 protein aurora borealis [Perognathus longimembris pacificus]